MILILLLKMEQVKILNKIDTSIYENISQKFIWLRIQNSYYRYYKISIDKYIAQDLEIFLLENPETFTYFCHDILEKSQDFVMKILENGYYQDIYNICHSFFNYIDFSIVKKFIKTF